MFAICDLTGKTLTYVTTTGTGTEVFEKGYVGISLPQLSLQFIGLTKYKKMNFKQPYVYCVGDYRISNFKKENLPPDQLKLLEAEQETKKSERIIKINSFANWIFSLALLQ